MPKEDLFRILSLDGGGAKGFYTLGVLKELEAATGCPLHQRFNLIFGTSTGAIIAALLALGASVDEIHDLYKKHVPSVMRLKKPAERSAALHNLADTVFGQSKFDAVKTRVGIVATRWIIERPMIFKSDVAQAYGRRGSFAPGFGCTIGDAVQASCSAYPFFDKKVVRTSSGDDIELVDGGYCANNPSLYALADAIVALGAPRPSVRLVSIGVGTYPPPKTPFFSTMWFAKRYLQSVQILQKTLEINTQSMDQLRTVLFGDIATIRISDTFEQPEMATDMFEHDLSKLNILRQRGSESFARHEVRLKDFVL
jgi:predicted acylesterase/phospholipase RssA